MPYGASFFSLLTSWRWCPAGWPHPSIWEPSSSSGNWCMDAVGPFRGVEWAEVSIGRRRGIGLPCKAGKLTSDTTIQTTGISTFGWWRRLFPLFSKSLRNSMFITFFFCVFIFFWLSQLLHFLNPWCLWSQNNMWNKMFAYSRIRSQWWKVWCFLFVRLFVFSCLFVFQMFIIEMGSCTR